MEQDVYYRTDFREIFIDDFLLKFVGTFQFPFKSEKKLTHTIQEHLSKFMPNFVTNIVMVFIVNTVTFFSSIPVAAVTSLTGVFRSDYSSNQKRRLISQTRA
jgi:hypothetical protein